MRIGSHISALLFNYDCVIIPGLGGFVANHSPARIQPEKQLAYPPSKGIIFNKNLISNDGLLAEYISRHENISYPEAQNLIQQFVTDSKNKLERGERIIFDELGMLYFDSEKNIQFQPDFSLNFLIESFGLSPVVARELIQEENKTEQEASVVSTSERSAETREADSGAKEISIKHGNFRKYWPAAAAVMIPLAFYSFWIPFGTNYLKTGNLQFSDLNPFRKKSAQEYQLRKNTVVFSQEADIRNEWENLASTTGGPVGKLIIGDNGNYLNVYLIPETESTFVAKRNIPDASFRHHIIAGCFREINNAEQLVKDLNAKGYNARILDIQNGLHRVAIGSYADKNEAISEMNKIRSNGHPSAWMLEK